MGASNKQRPVILRPEIKKIVFRDLDKPSKSPCLVVPRPLYDDMMTRCRLLEIECSGMGAVVPEDGNLVVKELYRVPQKCTMGHTNLEQDKMHDAILRCVEKYGIDPRFWWHSHNSMGAFWSATDKHTMDELFKAWGVSLVISHDGTYEAALTIGRPVKVQIDLPMFVVGQPQPIDVDRIKKELAEDIVHEFWAPHTVTSSYPPTSGAFGLDFPDSERALALLDHYEAQEEHATEIQGASGEPAGLPETGGPHSFDCQDCDEDCAHRGRWDRWDHCPHAVEDGPVDDTHGGVGPRHR